MIPLVIPPLSNLRVLVTRPAHQAALLCNAIAKFNGEVMHLPVLDIRSREVVPANNRYDLIIFVSANAVTHGINLLNQLAEKPLIAVIGKATASTLQAAGIEAAITAPLPFNSEALLQHEAMQSPPESILLIKGVGGRDLLRDSLISRGAKVEVADVYERVIANIDEKVRHSLHQALSDKAINAITITSTDIAQALTSMLDQPDVELIHACTVVAGSKRIADQLPSLGWHGEIIVSDSPDDDSMLKTLMRWHARGRN